MRPLSCTRPKHLFLIAGKPLLDWTLERLAKGGVSEVVFAVNNLSNAFAERYGKSAFGIKLHYSHEEKPLGTGGCIKNAQKTIGRSEPFFLLNGDIISNIDFNILLSEHVKNKATATIALFRVDDPSRYGVVELTPENRIKRFMEKPKRGKAPSNLINAGVYILNPEIFDYIPSGRRVSIEREVFPALARDKELYGHQFEGLWIDIGEPADYLKGNKLLLDAELQKGHIPSTVKLQGRVEINHPVAVGEHTTIRDKSKIGPHVTVGDRVTIGRDVHIENSIVFSGAVISDFSSLKGTIIGEDVAIGKRVKINEDCLVGDQAMIHDRVTLAKGTTVCPQKEVVESVLSARHIM